MNVGVLSRGFEPFVFVNDDSYSGISIEIWERAAKFANIKYKYVDAGKSYSQAIKDLANGKYDILIGPYSISEKNYQLVDYTSPYFISKIGLCVKKKSVPEQITYFIFKIISFLVLVLLISVLVNMFYLRLENKSLVSFQNIIDVTFENTFSLLQGEILSQPKTTGGKFILLLYAIMGLIILALSISSIRGILDPNTSDDKSIYSYIKEQNVITRKGTKAEKMVKKLKGNPYGISYQGSKNYSYDDLIDKLLENTDKFSAVCGDIPYIQYTLSKGGNKYSDLTVHNDILALNTYSFPIRKGSKLLEKIDLAIMTNKDDKINQLIASKYLGPNLSIQASF
jgi:ABC-type amino acid transport substrate-binding protein